MPPLLYKNKNKADSSPPPRAINIGDQHTGGGHSCPPNPDGEIDDVRGSGSFLAPVHYKGGRNAPPPLKGSFTLSVRTIFPPEFYPSFNVPPPAYFPVGGSNYKNEKVLPMIQIGDTVPDFTVECCHNSSFREVSLSDYRGRWLIVFFYPMDFTFVCPTEIKGFNDSSKIFESLKTDVLGVSTDSVHCHKAWIERDFDSLSFPLASDTTHALSRQFGVMIENKGIALRGTFIIDPEGVLRYSLIHDNNIGRNTDEVIRSLQALQSGGLCPVSWHPGEDFVTVK